MRYNFTLAFAVIIFIGCTTKVKPINLTNDLHLKPFDSLVIQLDSLTYPYSSNIHYKDSILFIQNDETNTISLYKISGQQIKVLDFSKFKGSLKNFSVNASWFITPDSIFVHSQNHRIVYLFDSSLKLKDSFLMPQKEDFIEGKQNPGPRISWSQQPVYYNKSLFTTGFTIGENFSIKESDKFVVCESRKDGRFFYVNYPTDYSLKNLGGIYYRMVYDCVISDSVICISFPASSTIALFNLKNKSVTYHQTYPEISNYIQPFKGDAVRKLEKDKIAKHFYGQYSFRGIIFDKYRNLFFRFLLKPTTEEYLTKMNMGPQEKFLLVYDTKFNYLGYTELDSKYSDNTYFVTEKGLYIKRIKYKNDEDNLYFDIFDVNGFITK